MGNQLLRSGTSVGANYRAACRGRSSPDFASKLAIALEEADESLYWLELLGETRTAPAEMIGHLIQEANELVSIFVAGLNTAKNRAGGRPVTVPTRRETGMVSARKLGSKGPPSEF